MVTSFTLRASISKQAFVSLWVAMSVLVTSWMPPAFAEDLPVTAPIAESPIGPPPPFPPGSEPENDAGVAGKKKEDDDSDDDQPLAPTPSQVKSSLQSGVQVGAFFGAFLGIAFAKPILQRTLGGIDDLVNIRSNRSRYARESRHYFLARKNVEKGLENVEKGYKIYRREFKEFDEHIDKLLDTNHKPLNTLLREADEHADKILQLPILKQPRRQKQREVVEAGVKAWKKNRDFRPLNEWVMGHLEYDALKKGEGPSWLSGYADLQQAIAARYWKEHRSTEKLDAWIQFGNAHGVFERGPLKVWLHGESAKDEEQVNLGYIQRRDAETQKARALVQAVATVTAEAAEYLDNPRAFSTLKIRDDSARDPGEFHHSSSGGNTPARSKDIWSETSRRCQMQLDRLANQKGKAGQSASLTSSLIRTTIPAIPVGVATVIAARKVVAWMDSNPPPRREPRKP